MPKEDGTGKTPQKASRSSGFRSSIPRQSTSRPSTSKSSFVPRTTMTPAKNRLNATAIPSLNNMKDTRPLQDKLYQQEMVNRVEEFLCEVGQAHLLNENRSLKPITLKIFVDVTNVLLEIITSGQFKPITAQNYVEIIPTLAKKFQYPAVINKSWLKTANAMHSWPNVIGWLSWLTAIAKIKTIANQKFTLETMPFKGQTEEEQEQNKKKFNVLISCYSAWKDERFDEEAKLLEKYFKESDCALGITDEQLQMAKDNLKTKKDIFEKENRITEDIQNENATLKAKLLALENMKAKKKKGIDFCNTEIKNLNEANKNILQTRTVLIENKKKTFENLEQLEQKIEKQPMSVSERDKQLKAIAEDEKLIAQLENDLREVQRQDYKIEMMLEKLDKDIQEKVKQYRSIIFNDMNKNVHNIEIPLNSMDIPAMAMSEPKFFDTVQDKMNTICKIENDFVVEVKQIKQLDEIVKREIDTVKGEATRLSFCRQECVENEEEVENMIEKVMQKFDQEEKIIKAEIEKLEYEIREKTKNTPRIDILVDELSQVEAQLKASQEKRAFYEERMNLFFEKLSNVKKKHLQEMKKIMDTLS